MRDVEARAIAWYREFAAIYLGDFYSRLYEVKGAGRCRGATMWVRAWSPEEVRKRLARTAPYFVIGSVEAFRVEVPR